MKLAVFFPPLENSDRHEAMYGCRLVICRRVALKKTNFPFRTPKAVISHLFAHVHHSKTRLKAAFICVFVLLPPSASLFQSCT